jgi:hypothetical protein
LNRLRIVWLLLGASALAGMVLLFVLPTRWEVSRSAEIAAPPEAIWPHLVELKRWSGWSPWQESAYPGLVFRYTGPASGPGAEVSWDSKATGDGVLRIVEAESPGLLRFEMAFQKGRIKAIDTIRLEPLGEGRTTVTWEDRGDLGRTLFGRLSLRMVKESMGRDLERGLAGLAKLATADPPAPSSPPAPDDATPSAQPPSGSDPGGEPRSAS